MTWLLPALPPTWDAALRDVHAQDPSARVAAAKRLAQPEGADPSRALGSLDELLRDRDARVRAAAVEALGELADVRSLEALTRALDDDDSLVRELACIALARLPGEAAADAVLHATTSTHPEVRFQAIASAAELRPERAEPIVRRLLSDGDGRVRASAARAVGALPRERRSDGLVRALIDELRDPERLTRGEASIVLASSGDARASAALAEALNEPELIWQALDAAPSLPAPRDVALIESIRLLAQSFLKPRSLKAAAARALIRMNDAYGVIALRDVLLGLRSEGRTYAVEVVGELHLLEFAAVLAALARRPRGAEPMALVKSLGALAQDSEISREALELLRARQDEVGVQAGHELAQANAVLRHAEP